MLHGKAGGTMRKDEMIQLIQTEIKLQNEKLNAQNSGEVSDAIQSQLAILKVVNDAIFYFDEDEKESEDSPLKPIALLDLAKENEYLSADKKIIRGYFNQNVRGGCILDPENPDSVFVPEKIIRLLELNDGDFIQATEKEEGNPPLKSLYDYTVINRTTAQNKVRCVDRLIPVKLHTDLNRLFVEISPQDSELTFDAMLNDNDIDRFDIKQGDIIDYAYKPAQYEHGKVVWKYDSSITQANTRATTRRKLTKATKKEIHVDSSLEGIQIVTVGGMSYKLAQSAKIELEKRQARVTNMAGTEPVDSITSEIKQSDIVIVYTESVSHDAMYTTKKICKKYPVKCIYTENIGATGIVRKVQEHFKVD